METRHPKLTVTRLPGIVTFLYRLFPKEALVSSDFFSVLPEWRLNYKV